MALAVGARVVDGVLALQSENFGGPEQQRIRYRTAGAAAGCWRKELARAKDVQKAANDKEWLVVFSELGRLQVDVIRALDIKGREARARW